MISFGFYLTIKTFESFRMKMKHLWLIDITITEIRINFFQFHWNRIQNDDSCLSVVTFKRVKFHEKISKLHFYSLWFVKALKIVMCVCVCECSFSTFILFTLCIRCSQLLLHRRNAEISTSNHHKLLFVSYFICILSLCTAMNFSRFFCF